MSRNIEIKARLDNFDALQTRVAAIADKGPVELAQDDSFFRCETGRLKLRRFRDGTGELIFYQRPDETGPKASFYVVSKTSDPNSLCEALTRAYGVIGRVRKLRTLYRVGGTRVHLDDVEGLGRFVELEVVLDENESIASGRDTAVRIMSQLGIERSQLVEGAYLDLIASQRK